MAKARERFLLLRSVAAGVALLLLGGTAAAFAATEWNLLERETPRLDAAWGAAAGRAAACGRGDAAAWQRQFYDFILRYLSADAAAKQLERFEEAEAATRRAPCDRYLMERDSARAREARAHIEPVLRDHGF